MATRVKIAMGIATATVAVVLLLVILDMLFVGAPWWPFHKDEDWFIRTVSSLKALYNVICAYREDTGRYPEHLDELRRFLKIEGPADPRNDMFCDTWERSLVYVHRGPRLNQDSFDLYSRGPNGKDEYGVPGFGDDIHIRVGGMVKPPADGRK